MTDPNRTPVVTIDGPGGSGKGTISRLLANRLGFHYLDSGAIYRLLALKAIKTQTPSENGGALTTLAIQLDIAFTCTADGTPGVELDGANVGEAIRSEACGEYASRIAALPEVRAALMERQRAQAQPPGLVADGRDMGTVVFPEADVKIFLTASLEERALRRQKQLMEQGISASLPDLLDDLSRRDQRDSSRSVAPLKPAPDAVLLDTTGKDIATVITEALEWVGRGITTA